MSRKTLTWIDAIEKVLEEADHPLHSNQIADAAIRRGLVKSGAMLPDHTVQAAVLRHIKNHGNPKGFVMIGTGRILRKYWLQRRQWELS